MKMQSAFQFGALILALALPNSSLAETTPPEFSKVSPNAQDFKFEGFDPQKPVPRSLAGSQTWDVIHYSSIGCQPNWNQYCEGTYTFTAPPNFQVCKLVYTVAATNGRTKFWQQPTNWYTNDPESPDRFRSIQWFMGAYGSGNIFDQSGATFILTNVGLKVLRADATNQDRYAAGCDMPAHD